MMNEMLVRDIEIDNKINICIDKQTDCGRAYYTFHGEVYEGMSVGNDM